MNAILTSVDRSPKRAVMTFHLLLILLVAAPIWVGCGQVQSPDYYIGYRAGQLAARKAIQDHPISSRIGNAMTPTGGLGKSDRSTDWNAGFLGAWTDEFKK